MIHPVRNDMSVAAPAESAGPATRRVAQHRDAHDTADFAVAVAAAAQTTRPAAPASPADAAAESPVEPTAAVDGPAADGPAVDGVAVTGPATPAVGAESPTSVEVPDAVTTAGHAHEIPAWAGPERTAAVPGAAHASDAAKGAPVNFVPVAPPADDPAPTTPVDPAVGAPAPAPIPADGSTDEAAPAMATAAGAPLDTDVRVDADVELGTDGTPPVDADIDPGDVIDFVDGDTSTTPTDDVDHAGDADEAGDAGDAGSVDHGHRAGLPDVASSRADHDGDQPGTRHGRDGATVPPQAATVTVPTDRGPAVVRLGTTAAHELPERPSWQGEHVAEGAFRPTLLAGGMHQRLSMEVGDAELGRMRLEATTHDGEVRLSLTSAEAATSGLVSARAHELIADLRQAGVNVGNLDVRTGTPDGGAAHQQQPPRPDDAVRTGHAVLGTPGDTRSLATSTTTSTRPGLSGLDLRL